MTLQWKLAPTPKDDELLSSFLVRVAHAHGTGAYRFFSYHLPHTSIWNRDIDRSVSDATLDKIAQLSGNTVERIQDMTLRCYMNLSRLNSNKANVKKIEAISPWINSIGIYHTTRRKHGLQYCPACLIDSPFFRKNWRMSFATICPHHNCYLLDACPSCDSPIAPHRNHVSNLHCHICHMLLINTPLREINSDIYEKLREIQDLFLKGYSPKIEINAEFNELLVGIHVLLSILRKRRNHYRSSDILLDAGEAPVELLRKDSRFRVLIFMYQLLSQWPDSFHKLANEVGLNQRHAIGYINPSWLQSELNMLPIGKPKEKVHRTKTAIADLKSNQRQKPDGWRTKRAELLLKIIKNTL